MLLCISETFSQVTPRQRNDSTQIVNLIHADRFGYEKIDSVNELQTLVGNVQLEQDGTYFSGDSVIIKNGKIIEAFGNVHINDKDSVHTWSQYLLYYVDPKLATLKNKVKLTDGKTTLTTEELHYDVNARVGEYYNGGTLVNKNSVLTSQEGTYYSELKDAYFKKNVRLKDPAYELASDSLLYNTETELTTFVAPTFIKDSSGRTIQTSEGYYDLKNKQAFFGKRPQIQDGATFVTADVINTNDSSGISILTGNAVYTDTAQGVSILANLIRTNRDSGTMLATQKPLMIIKQERDSIYITADTLFSGRMADMVKQLDSLKRMDTTGTFAGNYSPPPTSPATTGPTTMAEETAISDTSLPLTMADTAQLSAINDSLTAQQNAISDSMRSVTVNDTVRNKNDSADRYFQAYHHVRIFSDSMQAVSDSLFYSGRDSIFRLFIDPVMWTGNSQVTGDTIYLFTKNKKPREIQVFENGMAVERSGEDMYNQVRGNRMYAYFDEGNINLMRAKGNAESVYYVLDDDSAVVGVNKVVGDLIDMRFSNTELDRVVVIGQPSGNLIPLTQATEQDKTLRDFKWMDARRPKNKFELFESGSDD
jgi:lipopolysaccharide export system protein LptA